MFFVVAVLDFRAAETGASVVRLPIHPIKYAAVNKGHRALIRLAQKSLFGFRVEITAGLTSICIRPVDASQTGEGVIQILFRKRELALSHRGGGGAVLPEHFVTRRPVGDGVRAIYH